MDPQNPKPRDLKVMQEECNTLAKKMLQKKEEKELVTLRQIRQLERRCEELERELAATVKYRTLLSHNEHTDNSFVGITPSTLADWREVDNLPRTTWDYTYLAPHKDSPNTRCAMIGKNTTWQLTTKKIGKMAYVDFTDKVAKLNDGEYEVRDYYNGKEYQTLVVFRMDNGEYTEFFNSGKI